MTIEAQPENCREILKAPEAVRDFCIATLAAVVARMKREGRGEEIGCRAIEDDLKYIKGELCKRR